MGLRNELLVLFVICLSFAISIPFGQANVYSIDFYQDSTGNPAESSTASYFPIQDCIITLNSFASFSDPADYSATTTYKSPGNTIIGTGTRPLTGNRTCVNMGFSDTNIKSGAGYYEALSSIGHNADSGTNYLRASLNCDIPGDYINFTSNNTKKDSRGYVVNAYYKNVQTASGVTSGYIMAGFMNSNNFTDCQVLETSKFDGDITTSLDIHTLAFYYPFNSSGSGVFNYDLDAYNVVSGGTFAEWPTLGYLTTWFYYKKSDSSSLTTLCLHNCTGSVSLDPETEYVLMLYKTINHQLGTTYINSPKANFDINIYSPAWDCSEFTECDNGTKQRTCVDPLNKVPDLLDFEACYVGASKFVSMGFEETEDVNVFYSYNFQYPFLDCECYAKTESVEYPAGWEVQNSLINIADTGDRGYQDDYIKMTSETAYLGSKSLKMWYIPPSANYTNPITFLGWENETYELNETHNTGLKTGNTTTGTCDQLTEGYTSNNQYLECLLTLKSGFLRSGFDLSSIHHNETILNITVKIEVKRDLASDSNLTIKLYHNSSGTYTNNITIPYTSFNATDINITIGNGTWGKTWSNSDLNALKVNFTLVGIVTNKKTFIDYLAINVTYGDLTNITTFGASLYQSIGCTDIQAGIVPDVNKPFNTSENDSIFVERNITLPSPYMSVFYAVKRCITPEVHYASQYVWPWGLVCGEQGENTCYTNTKSCNEDVHGQITFYLKDETGTIIYDVPKVDGINPNSWNFVEYAIDSLEPNSVYTIGFAVAPEDNQDIRSWCVYLDDVRIQVREEPITCVSECIGTVWNERTCLEYDDSENCIFCDMVEDVDSEICIASERVKDKIDICESWCGCENINDPTDSGYLTYHKNELLTGCNVTLEDDPANCCFTTLIENSDYCVSYCETQNVGQIDIDTSEFLTSLGVPEFYHPLASPMAFLIYIAIIISVAVMLITKSWEVTILVSFLVLMLIGFMFEDLAFIVILVIVGVGLLFGKEMISNRKGG